MEITKEMVAEYMTRFPDVSPESAEGSLAMWANGQGVLDAELINGNEVLAPIAEAYFAIKGVEVPESVKVPLTPVDEGVTDIMDEKLPEDAPTAK